MSLQAALEAYRQGDNQRAYAIARAITEDEPDNENAWVLLLELTDNESERAQIAERILQLNPHNPAALKAQVAQGQRNWDDEERVYEMLWDCEYCGTDKLLGKTHRFCPHCGAGQDAEKRYFPEEADKVAVQDHVFFGADKLCPACGTANSGKAEFCQQCGSPLDSAQGIQTQADQIRTHDATHFAAEDAESNAATARSSKGFPWWLLGIVVLLIGGILVFFLWTKEVSAVLTGHSWERTITIEQYGPKASKAWCDQMPNDAYNIDRKREVRSHKKVPDGQRCDMRRIDQGDGTYIERQECETVYREEPVYDARCYFTVDRWQYERTAQAQANDLKPYWPNPNLRREGNCRGCERATDRQARYILHFAQDGQAGENFTCPIEQKHWQNAKPKSRWQLEVGVLVGDVRCGSLQLK